MMMSDDEVNDDLGALFEVGGGQHEGDLLAASIEQSGINDQQEGGTMQVRRIRKGGMGSFKQNSHNRRREILGQF